MNFFSRNIGFPSRMARGVIGAVLVIAGILRTEVEFWSGIAMVLLGLFALFEAVRGWSLARACGLKAKSKAMREL
jgi:hypothetical protein